MAEVSVILPVYNGQNYLNEAIESILNQNFRDFEFLILDDGSTDESVSIISSYHDDRIRLLKNSQRLKLAGALNRGIAEARGKLIARMDADDIADKQRLQHQVAFMNTHPNYGICGSWVRRFGTNSSTIDKNPVNWEEIRAYSLFECPFSHPTVLFRKHFFIESGLLYKGDYYPTEDYELWSRAVHLFPCANLPKVLLKYRVHSSGMTGKEWDDMDAQGARIGKTNLKHIGIAPTEEESWLHRNVGRAGSRPCHNLVELNEAKNWLAKIWQANEEERFYQPTAMQTILNLVWFRVCFNAAPLGLLVFDNFRRRPWKGKDPLVISRSLLLLASILKHRILQIRLQRLTTEETR